MDGAKEDILKEIRYVRNRIDEVYDLVYQNCADCDMIEERLNNHIEEHKRILATVVAIIIAIISAHYLEVF